MTHICESYVYRLYLSIYEWDRVYKLYPFHLELMQSLHIFRKMKRTDCSKKKGYISTLNIVKGLFWLYRISHLPMDKYTEMLYNYE